MVRLVAVAVVAAACGTTVKHIGNPPLGPRRPAPSATTTAARALDPEAAAAHTPEGTHDVLAADARVGDARTSLFHRAGCAELGAVPGSARVLFASAFDAVDAHYAPCPNCRPGP